METQERKVTYWYKQYITECPVCGREDSWKERQYTIKPKNSNLRYFFEQVYDWCDSL